MNITRLADALDNLDMSQALPFSVLRSADACSIILYRPQAEDQQTPHEQDEYYFVAQGSGDIVISGERHAVATGDAIFVPARAEHRFENVSDGFACWAVFLNT